MRRAIAPPLPRWVALGALVRLVGVAAGYACAGRNPTADQAFTVPGTDIVGTIHGWMSNCYDVIYQCGIVPTTSCSTVNNVQTCSTIYTPIYCTQTYTNRAPWQYVADFAALVQACGGSLSAAAAQLGSLHRIAGNAEHDHWVRVAVSAFNGSAGLDPTVACIHRI